MRYYHSLAFLSAMLIAGSASAYSSVPVLTGGVGESSRSVMEQRQDAYNLKTVFTGERGMYLSEVNVTIRDSAGNIVVSGVSQGPYLLADLAPGRYTLEATAEGHTKKQTINVKESGLKTYHMRFPIQDEISYVQ